LCIKALKERINALKTIDAFERTGVPAGTSRVSSCTSLTSKHLKRHQIIETPSVMHARTPSMVDPPEYFNLNIKIPQISRFILHLLD